MKKTTYLIILICLVFVCGCGKEETVREVFDYDIYEYPAAGTENAVILLKDYSSYLQYRDEMTAVDVKEEFEEALSSYTEDFFEKEMLIVLLHWETTGRSELSLNDIVYEKNHIEVVLKGIYPDTLTEDMKDYAFLIRIPKDDSYSTVSYSQIKEDEKKWYE